MNQSPNYPSLQWCPEHSGFFFSYFHVFGYVIAFAWKNINLCSLSPVPVLLKKSCCLQRPKLKHVPLSSRNTKSQVVTLFSLSPLGKSSTLWRPQDFYFLSLSEDIFPLLLEREEGRERNINVERNIDWLPFMCFWTRYRMLLDQGLNPQPSYVPWPGIQPTTFWLRKDIPTSWAALTRADHRIF